MCRNVAMVMFCYLAFSVLWFMGLGWKCLLNMHMHDLRMFVCAYTALLDWCRFTDISNSNLAVSLMDRTNFRNIELQHSLNLSDNSLFIYLILTWNTSRAFFNVVLSVWGLLAGGYCLQTTLTSTSYTQLLQFCRTPRHSSIHTHTHTHKHTHWHSPLRILWMCLYRRCLSSCWNNNKKN